MSKLLSEFSGLGSIVSSPIFQLELQFPFMISLYDDKLVLDNISNIFIPKKIVFKKDEIECIKQAKLIGGIQIVHKKPSIKPYVYFNPFYPDVLDELLKKLKECNYPLK
jgi:hypothetical protein